jgi:DNA-binding GntR family transcriptional regulator
MLARRTRAKRTRGTGASYVYESLNALILDLELKQGTLLDETLVSRQLSVSRSPVREALIRLSAEGLVQTLGNRTSIVAPFDIGALPAYFDAMPLLYRAPAWRRSTPRRHRSRGFGRSCGNTKTRFIATT